MVIVEHHQENISLMSELRFVLNLAKHYSIQERRGARQGRGVMHINWHLSQSPTRVKHVRILKE